MRRTGDIRKDSAGLQRREPRFEERDLQPAELGDVARLLAPARLRAAAERPETRAGCVHQREVGTGYFDRISTVLNPGSATLALIGSTESEQFH